MRKVWSNLVRRILFVALATVLPGSVGAANAITITYVNVGPLDSRVFVGFSNNASGNTTSDLVMDPSAYSRNDTLYGPLPPVGQLPNFDAMVYAAAELGTDLNAPLGTGVRWAAAPLNFTFVQAHGETLAATGSYSSDAFAFSGNTTSTSPTAWIIHVDPSGSEVAGTPTDVTVTGNITGFVSVAGASVANASWNVATTSFGTVMSGVASQTVPGTTPFTDAGSITFTIPLGSTFQLEADYDQNTSGSGAGANSTAQIDSFLVQIAATIPTPVVPVLVAHFIAPIFDGTTVVSPAGPFPAGRTIPVRFQLQDGKGNLISGPEGRKLDVGVTVFSTQKGAEKTPIDLGPKPPALRYHARRGVFALRLKTKDQAWSAGQTYRIEVSVAGTPVGEAFFALR